MSTSSIQIEIVFPLSHETTENVVSPMESAQRILFPEKSAVDQIYYHCAIL